MTTFETMTSKIIHEQELIIGPLAWSEAQKVQGLKIGNVGGEVLLSSDDPKGAINRLVAQYERLFGRASRETCREAVASIIADLSPSEIPSSLLPA